MINKLHPNNRPALVAPLTRCIVTPLASGSKKDSLAGLSYHCAKLRKTGSIDVQKWEYRNIRFDDKGRGNTQELNKLDIDAKRQLFTDKTLPKLLNEFGKEGWELVNHSVLDDGQRNLVTWHYMFFKRPLTE